MHHFYKYLGQECVFVLWGYNHILVFSINIKCHTIMLERQLKWKLTSQLQLSTIYSNQYAALYLKKGLRLFITKSLLGSSFSIGRWMPYGCKMFWSVNDNGKSIVTSSLFSSFLHSIELAPSQFNKYNGKR